MAAAMFMNSNSLPIALLQSLVVSIPNLHWGSDDTSDAMVGRALTYLVLCSALGMMVCPYLPDFPARSNIVSCYRFDGVMVSACSQKQTRQKGLSLM